MNLNTKLNQQFESIRELFLLVAQTFPTDFNGSFDNKTQRLVIMPICFDSHLPD